MKKLLLLLLFIPLVSFGQDCPPCDIIANEGMNITKVNTEWPKLEKDEINRINSLTNVRYTGDEKFWVFMNRKSWWLNDKSDPWSLTTDWVNNYEEPNHKFNECVNDKLRWMCGYSFSVKLPEKFKKNKKYPLLIFLHGSIKESSSSLTRKVKNLSNNFYMSQSDQYIIAAPIKLGVDWSSKRIQDMIENIKSNINIDESRIYLTGLSMGGRGTFIVAAELPDLFAAIMPLSPHHTPYSYVKLASKVSDLPIFLHHSTNDKTSKFSIAEKMSEELKKLNANIIFDVGEFGHSGWNKIYKNPDNINWLLSWQKSK